MQQKKHKRKKGESKEQLIIPDPQQNQTRKVVFRAIFLSWKTFVVGLGLIVSVLYFYPRVQVSPTQPLDPKNAFTAPFLITNAGNAPIINVHFSYEIPYAHLSGYSVRMNKMMTGQLKHISMTNFSPPLSNLRPGRTSTFDCNFYAFATIEPQVPDSIILNITITYEFLFLHFRETFPFMTVKESSGLLRWIYSSTA